MARRGRVDGVEATASLKVQKTLSTTSTSTKNPFETSYLKSFFCPPSRRYSLAEVAPVHRSNRACRGFDVRWIRTSLSSKSSTSTSAGRTTGCRRAGFFFGIVLEGASLTTRRAASLRDHVTESPSSHLTTTSSPSIASMAPR